MNLCLKHASELDLARYHRRGVDPDALMCETFVHSNRLAALVDDTAMARPAMQMQHAAGGAMSGHASHVHRGAAGHGAVLDLGKSWHALHFLFTGQAWGGPLPAATLLAGGQEVGEDLGYGRARTIAPHETADFAGFLAALSVPGLQTRIDVRVMLGYDIYCVDDDGIATRTEVTADVAHYLPRLKAHVERAAAKGHGLLVWMS